MHIKSRDKCRFMSDRGGWGWLGRGRVGWRGVGGERNKNSPQINHGKQQATAATLEKTNTQIPPPRKFPDWGPFHVWWCRFPCVWGSGVQYAQYGSDCFPRLFAAPESETLSSACACHREENSSSETLPCVQAKRDSSWESFLLCFLSWRSRFLQDWRLLCQLPPNHRLWIWQTASCLNRWDGRVVSHWRTLL